VYAYDSDYYGRCKPVLYSDNGGIPLTRKSQSEGSFDIAVGSGKPAGWRSTTFQTNGALAQGSYIWFGLFCDWFAPRFDYGTKCYRDFWDSVGDDIPGTYPLYQASNYYDFKLSMYFSYTSAQNYTRTLAQGVTLSDSRKLTASYKRSLIMNTKGDTLLGHASAYYRKHSAGVQSTDRTGHLGDYLRGLYTEAGSVAETHHAGEYYRLQQDTVTTQALSFRHLIVFIRLVTVGLIRDYLIPRFLRSKEEIVLKSKVSREIELDSRIH
jgi:hypothetical protein